MKVAATPEISMSTAVVSTDVLAASVPLGRDYISNGDEIFVVDGFLVDPFGTDLIVPDRMSVANGVYILNGVLGLLVIEYTDTLGVAQSFMLECAGWIFLPGVVPQAGVLLHLTAFGQDPDRVRIVIYGNDTAGIERVQTTGDESGTDTAFGTGSPIAK